MKNEILRHGDLLLIPCEKIPDEAKKLNTLTIALGEVTGHHHTLNGDCLVYELDKTKYIQANQESVLEHQEHKTIPIEKGFYKLVIEQEFDPFSSLIRRVRD